MIGITRAKFDGIIDLDLIASLYTPSAQDAAGKIADDKRIGRFHRVNRLARGKFGPRDLITVSQVLKPAVTPDRAQFTAGIFVLHSELKSSPVRIVGAANGTVMIAR